MSAAVQALEGGLVVSCQAGAGHPLADPEVIARLAACAEAGGAVGVRVESAEDVRAVRRRIGLPIIAIRKVDVGAHRPFITPTLADCAALAEAGADIIALEAVPDNRAQADEAGDLIRAVREQLGRPVMADVATLEEGLAAWSAGADLVGTTLSGYTLASASRIGPDLALLADLASHGVRAVLEGRVDRPEQVRAAFGAGAWTVVVGTAITDPISLTRRYAAGVPRKL
ncbi:putative N-acetylmannosamine-6-phosphate 2-epimerase [Actinopolymorpha rutila]|uniref:N-acylglucosamine-6-phosphate 2-epimerase n=1 Tax=Actinopolymorpha rutila TaxID=446787 RepID=A0A852Z4Z6_9ACTN|nr:N-acylglucosamine-6-phosphate 2-epimerase [Actinopolymorpha rutila]